jgi:hypothetical protein
MIPSELAVYSRVLREVTAGDSRQHRRRSRSRSRSRSRGRHRSHESRHRGEERHYRN